MTLSVFRKQQAMENAIRSAMSRFEEATGLKVTSVRVQRTGHHILAVITRAELTESPEIPTLKDTVEELK